MDITERITKLHTQQKRGIMTDAEFVDQVIETVAQNQGYGEGMDSSCWALIESVGGIPDVLGVYANFRDGQAAFRKHLHELQVQKDMRIDSHYSVRASPEDSLFASGHWNFDDSELRLLTTSFHHELSSPTPGEGRVHAPGGDMNEPVRVSKAMFVRADQLMLDDVVTNDGDLGTVFRLEADGPTITVNFHDGRMQAHEFSCMEHQELGIVRGNLEP